MEATKNTTKPTQTYAGMEPYNVQYYVAKYGTVENLTKDYIGAIDGLRMQYRQYETNPRKGGRYRREKMEHLRQQAEAIYDELLRVSRAMKEYFAATPTETPRISTETAEAVNVSAEGENAAERPQYRVWRFAKPNYAQIIVSDYSQWKVVAVLSFVWGKTQIEVSDDVANIHTIGKKELTIDKPLTELTDAEVLELIYNHTEPPQSPETPQTVECTAEPCELAQTA